MPAPSPLSAFLEPFERLGLPYCVTGSVAASVYGEPRLTADIDVVLLLESRDIPALRAAFPESEYYSPPDESLHESLHRGGMFNLIHPASSRRTSMSPREIRFTPGRSATGAASTSAARAPGSPRPNT